MKKNYNRGFSLVELLIAMAILGLIMVSIASFMSSTTVTYMKSRDDVALQQDGQEVFDAIADKLMQAKRVRIGTEQAEYAILGDSSSVKVGADYSLLLDTGATIAAPSLGDGSTRNKYAFNALTSGTISDTNNLVYIAVLYDTTTTDTVGNPAYGSVVDVYYFKEGKIYLFRTKGEARASSNSDGSVSTATDESMETLDSWMTSCVTTACNKIKNNTAGLDDNNLLCDTIEYDSDSASRNVSIYALPSDNALYMTMGLKNSKATNAVEGMITIRNSYVLQPRKFGTEASASTDAGDSDDSE
jgi:prepilin-type N-terminal cleavage/methylation domain-containing protein